MAWKDLTARQQSLDRAIESCGISLDGSIACLKNVMKKIGADCSEEEYVRNRIALKLRAHQLLGDTDSFIERTEKMLSDFEKDDAEWRARGKKLGFDF